MSTVSPSQQCSYASLVKINPLVQVSWLSYLDADIDADRIHTNFGWGYSLAALTLCMLGRSNFTCFCLVIYYLRTMYLFIYLFIYLLFIVACSLFLKLTFSKFLRVSNSLNPDHMGQNCLQDTQNHR